MKIPTLEPSAELVAARAHVRDLEARHADLVAIAAGLRQRMATAEREQTTALAALEQARAVALAHPDPEHETTIDELLADLTGELGPHTRAAEILAAELRTATKAADDAAELEIKRWALAVRDKVSGALLEAVTALYTAHRVRYPRRGLDPRGYAIWAAESLPPQDAVRAAGEPRAQAIREGFDPSED